MSPCGCCSKELTPEEAKNKEIERGLKKDKKKNVVSLLLLGAGKKGFGDCHVEWIQYFVAVVSNAVND